jgi:glycosyltransferase involved in cell wall biosynthesis
VNLLTIVIPVYNEEESLVEFLPEVLSHCKAQAYDLIVVNDGSKDASLKILEGFQKDDGINFSVISHKLNKGYGSALKTGIANSTSDYVITIDADGQHYLEDVDLLFEVIKKKNADLIVGSRKHIKSASVARGLGKTLIRAIAKMLMKLPIYDINSGMKIYETALVKKYLHLTPDNMSFSDIITLIFVSNRHVVLEEPIRLKDRYAGVSTIGVKTAFETVLEILNIIILFNPMRIFLPMALVSLFLGLSWGSYIFILGRGISVGANTLIISGTIVFLLGLIAEQLSAIRKNLN